MDNVCQTSHHRDNHGRRAAERTRPAIGRVWWLIGTLLCACATPHDPCQAGGETGKKYDARLDEIYDSSVTDVLFQDGVAESWPSCNSFDGLAMGGGVPFQVTAQEKSVVTECKVHLADVAWPASVQIMGSAPQVSPGDRNANCVAIFSAQASVAGCSGIIEIDFRAPFNRAFASRSPDAWPPFVVDRFFQTADASSCPAFGTTAATPFTCGDTWVATLTPQ
jgi:hypothetical protein